MRTVQSLRKNLELVQMAAGVWSGPIMRGL